MIQSTFNPGDEVELNSGGPPMTVSMVASEKVTCVWWDQPKQEYAERVFESAVLKPWVPLASHGGFSGTMDD